MKSAGAFWSLADYRRREPAGEAGVCLDTCHVNDAGYDIAGRLEDVLGEFDWVIGLERLRAIHLNDSYIPWQAIRTATPMSGKAFWA